MEQSLAELWGTRFAVVAGDTPAAEVEVLRGYFREVILLPPDPAITPPVSRHPEMNFAVVDEVLLTHAGYYGVAREEIERICTLGGFRVVLSRMARGAEYPRDVGFNALVLPGAVIGRLDSLAPELVSAAVDSGRRLIGVKQGYAACTTGVFYGNRRLLATADVGIAKGAEEAGESVVLLPEDTGIRLPGYDCGFLGGACGSLAGAAFFFGNPRRHPALGELCELLMSAGVTIVPLSEALLTDRGGIRIFSIV